MDTISMNSGNNKTSDTHRLLLDLSDKIDVKRSNKYVALSNLSIYYTWKNIKNDTKILNLKNQLRRGIKNMSYLMDHILHQIFKITLNISLKKHETVTDNYLQ